MKDKKILKKWLNWTYVADPDNSVDPDTIEVLKNIRTSKTTKKDHLIFEYYGGLTRLEAIEGYKTQISGDYKIVASSLTALELWLEEYPEYESILRLFLNTVNNPTADKTVPDCVFGFLKEVYIDVVTDSVYIYKDYFMDNQP